MGASPSHENDCDDVADPEDSDDDDNIIKIRNGRYRVSYSNFPYRFHIRFIAYQLSIMY